MKRNQYLYRDIAFNKYKLKEECENCKTDKNICVHHKDEDYLNNDKSNLQILCKACHIKHHRIGKKHTEVTKRKMSISHKGKILSEETKIKISNVQKEIGLKEILQYDLKGECIKKWSSLKEASIKLNITNSNICLCCKGKRKTAGGFVFKYNIS